VIKVDSLGEIVFISGQARMNLQEKSSDDAYFYELFTVPEDRSSGVYTGNCAKGNIWTRDHEGNYFEMDIYGKMTS